MSDVPIHLTIALRTIGKFWLFLLKIENFRLMILRLWCLRMATQLLRLHVFR